MPHPPPSSPLAIDSFSAPAARRNLLARAATADIHATTVCSDSNDIFLFHARCGRPDLASILFDQMPHRDVVLWTSFISAHCRNGASLSALAVFSNMLTDAAAPPPNEFTLAAVLQAPAQQKDAQLARTLHGFIVASGFIRDAFVYNSMLDNYSKCGLISDAEELIYRLECRDVVSWSVVISGCVLNGILGNALKLFVSMLEDGGEPMPDVVTVVSSIQACSEIALLQDGQILHGYAIWSGVDRDVFVCNALIDMYSKGGRIDLGEQVFEEMGLKDISSWNTMIAAYGIHGDGNSALKVFHELKEVARQQPNGITFNSLISACGHSGLRIEGCECFESMRRDYGIEPSMEHYASMVDLFGRCGRVAEAWDFIEEMPVEPGPDVWGSLLGACGIHGDVGIAERAAEKLSVLEPDETVWRVALANVYAKAGRWEDCAEVRAEMKRRGARKEVGWSSVELNGGERFRFMAGDTRHPETNSIYGVWNAIKQHMVDAFI